METEKFGQWCKISLMGHQCVAGFVSDGYFPNTIRVDIPDVNGNGPQTVYYGTSAIFEMFVVTKETARFVAETFNVIPIEEWDVRTMLKEDNWHSKHNVLYAMLNDVVNADYDTIEYANIITSICEYLDEHPKNEELPF